MERGNFSSRMYLDYISVVEESCILTTKLVNEFSEDDKSFKASLAKSRHRAIKEFRACHKDLVKLFKKINGIEDELSRDIQDINDKYKAYESAWHNIFEHFNLQLSKIFQYASDSLIGSFKRKVRRIDKFTICLFGRTKAGKSTTMEALTKGNGVAIGKGRQNMTQNVKEYHWRELLVIDTPGIDAMDKMDQLESMALSYADEADLIVFLLPHQIEEGDFDKFSRFHKQNKPILLLLNVKKEIGKKGSMEYKQFLKHTDDIFEEEKIAGYKKRINDFMLSKLNVKEGLIPVIPVHSASAFMALKEDDKEVKSKLYECSNFQALEDQLVKEISEYGELYRTKNPHETVILFAEKIVNEFRLFQDVLEQQKEVFNKNIVKFSHVKAEIIKKKNNIIRDKIESYFNSKKNSVSGLVNRLFDERDEDKRKKILAEFMPEEEIENKVREAEEEVIKIIKQEITNFFKTFSEDMANINFEAGKSEIFSKTNSDMNGIEGAKDVANLMDTLGLASGVLLSLGAAIVVADIGFLGASGTLFGLGAPNIWHPVGWLLLASSIFAGILGLLFKSKHDEKVVKAKKNAVNKISEKLKESKRKISGEAHKWVNKILNDLEKKHIGVMRKYVEYSGKHIKECDDLFSDLEKMCTKSRRKKFRAMLRCIQGDNKFKMTNVKENNDVIEIKILAQKITNREEIEQVLSRVEEKPVIIIGGTE